VLLPARRYLERDFYWLTFAALFAMGQFCSFAQLMQQRALLKQHASFCDTALF
jgi:hypothetical protein